MEKNLQIFIEKHEEQDPGSLILQKDKYPGIDIKTAARCIHGRKVIKIKVPSWHGVSSLLYPDSLPLEQCSSEATATYKQTFVPDNAAVADFTGGLGVDTYFMSLCASQVSYFEKNTELAAIVKHNMSELHRNNISVTNAETTQESLRKIPDNTYGLVYLDPARRGKSGERVFSIHDCEPDISVIKDELLRISGKVLIKISPMADISAIAKELPEVSEIHSVSLDGDCKEILLLMERHSNKTLRTSSCSEPMIFAADLSNGYRFTFRQSEEKSAEISFAQIETILPGTYLCEPCKAVMKTGAFKLLSILFEVRKIAPATHYYIAEHIPENFPGKIRKITAVYPFDKTFIKTFRTTYPECSITARNFPMTSDELKKKLRTAESDNFRLLATTSVTGKKIAIITETV